MILLKKLKNLRDKPTAIFNIKTIFEMHLAGISLKNINELYIDMPFESIYLVISEMKKLKCILDMYESFIGYDVKETKKELKLRFDNAAYVADVLTVGGLKEKLRNINFGRMKIEVLILTMIDSEKAIESKIILNQ